MLKLTSVELWLIQELTHTHTPVCCTKKPLCEAVCRAEWAELSQQQV